MKTAYRFHLMVLVVCGWQSRYNEIKYTSENLIILYHPKEFNIFFCINRNIFDDDLNHPAKN